MVRPEYPQEALLSGAEGWVNVSMSVTPAGGVLDPRVEESSNSKTVRSRRARGRAQVEVRAVRGTDPRAVTVRVEFKHEEIELITPPEQAASVKVST